METPATSVTDGMKGFEGLDKLDSLQHAPYRTKNYLLAISVDKYKNPKIKNLKNCVRDAEAFIEKLVEDFEFEKENVRFVCSGTPKKFSDIVLGEATERNILLHLRNLIRAVNKDKKADKDLKVNLILYFSGHGWFDKELDQGYWLPADAVIEDYASYISNSTILDYLKAIDTHHTLLIVDSCFSGSLLFSGESRNLGTRLEKDPSRWCLTAGRKELVSDGKLGKNSPFASSLLKILNNQDVISVQDLIVKVKEDVGSKELQLPIGNPLRVRGHEGGEFVFRKKKNAEKYYINGKHLMTLATHLPERERFLSAARQFEEAVRLSKAKEETHTYLLYQVRALCAAGEFEQVCQLLEGKSEDAEALFRLGSAYFLMFGEDQTHKTEAAKNIRIQNQQAELAKATAGQASKWLEQFVKKYPDDHRKTFANLILQWLDRYDQDTDRKVHVLLIGIDKYKHQNERLHNLEGCERDVLIMEDLFKKRWGQATVLVKKLINDQATSGNVKTALEALASKEVEQDAVLVFYAGHALRDINFQGLATPPEKQSYLQLHDAEKEQSGDTTFPGNWKGSINCEMLHMLMKAIPSKHKTLILDTHPHSGFINLAQKYGDYTLFLSAQPGQMTYERRHDDGVNGAFSLALYQTLEQFMKNNWASETNLHEKISRQLKLWGLDQKPLLIRESDFELAFQGDVLLYHLIDFFYGRIRLRSKNDLKGISTYLQWMGFHQDSLPSELLLHFGKAYALIRAWEEALPFFMQLEEQAEKHPALSISYPVSQVNLDLALTYIELGAYRKSAESLKKYLENPDTQPLPESHPAKLLENRLKRAENAPRYALLIGIDNYQNAARVHYAKKDAQAWKDLLVSKLGFKERNITVLLDNEATRQAVFHAFEALVKQSEQHPAFFYFAGNGSFLPRQVIEWPERLPDDSSARWTLLAYDSRLENQGDIPLLKLAKMARTACHMTTVIDAGFQKDSDRFEQAHSKLPPEFSEDLWRELPQLQEGFPYNVQIGNTTILPGAKAYAEKDKDRIYPVCRESGGGSLMSQSLRNWINPDLASAEKRFSKDTQLKDIIQDIQQKRTPLELRLPAFR